MNRSRMAGGGGTASVHGDHGRPSASREVQRGRERARSREKPVQEVFPRRKLSAEWTRRLCAVDPATRKQAHVTELFRVGVQVEADPPAGVVHFALRHRARRGTRHTELLPRNRWFAVLVALLGQGSEHRKLGRGGQARLGRREAHVIAREQGNVTTRGGEHQWQ
eukprot:scaffold3092_cov121-Isochrysis_galbana.AAC.14